MSLTAAERERGWVEFLCPEHGFLVATTPRAGVTCQRGRKVHQAYPYIGSRRLYARDITALAKAAQTPC